MARIAGTVEFDNGSAIMSASRRVVMKHHAAEPSSSWADRILRCYARRLASTMVVTGADEGGRETRDSHSGSGSDGALCDK